MDAQARSHSMVERGRRAGIQLGLSREDLVALGLLSPTGSATVEFSVRMRSLLIG